MGDLYSIDEGAGVYFNLADEYDTPNDAETAASAVGHPGVAMLRSIYLALPAVFSDELSAAKAAKVSELTAEGDIRCLDLSPAFQSVVVASALDLALKRNSLESEGKDLADIGEAYRDAQSDIDALTSLPAVYSYNVVTDPSWP